MSISRTHFSELVSVLPHDNRAAELTKAEFAELDLWTLPRNLTVLISDAPVFGSLSLRRTSRVFRADWDFDHRRTEGLADYPNTLITSVVQLGAIMTKEYSIRTKVSHTENVVSFWIPLSREGIRVLHPLGVELHRIWETAFRLSEALPHALRCFEVAEPLPLF